MKTNIPIDHSLLLTTECFKTQQCAKSLCELSARFHFWTLNVTILIDFKRFCPVNTKLTYVHQNSKF